MTDKQTCESCGFWDKHKKEQPMGVGSCHCKAPKKCGINILPSDNWPQTNHFDWCGEHSKGNKNV